MSFISIEFLILMTVVLICVSCVFYAWWDWRFFGMLVALTILDYYLSHALINTINVRKRKLLLYISIVGNLGVLGFLKYSNFFIDTLNLFFGSWGWRLGTLDIILPIGISFYIFETLCYVIDVYKGKTNPAESLLDYAIFVTFFPRLVAGPIMRAKEFLPQLRRGILINKNNLVEGVQWFLRGLLKKLVIADNVAVMVDQIYASPSLFSSPTVWLGVAAYSIQILYDFWGYTDMAIGIGKMLGFELPLNFNLPYTAQSISEFWTRWHISLSTWFRDYIFLPLAYSISRRLNKQRYIFMKTDFVIYFIAIIVTFVLTGLWHGAAWRFVLWGGLFSAYLIIERFFYGAKRIHHHWTNPKAWLCSSFVFVLVTITWIPFRSPDWQTTLLIIKKLLFVEMQYNIEWYYIWAMITVPLVLVGGWLARRFEWKWPILSIQKSYTPAFMLFEILIIYFFTRLNTSPFIYFQF
jgi:alginate O-acetyltransferase complex protein AlgI